MNFQQCNAVLFNEKTDKSYTGRKRFDIGVKEMCLAKTKLSRISGFFPKAIIPHLMSFHSSLIPSESEKRCFPIILPWENSACGWKLMSTAQHTQGQPGEVGLSSFLLPSFQGAWELP